MNALVVLLARLSTGLFLILWAFAVQQNSHGAVDLVTTLSQGFFADPHYRMALVYGAGAIGVFVILGLLRQLAYPLQAIALALAAASVWKSLADPLGIFFFTPADTNIFYFPMLALFVASLVPLALWDADGIALDSLIGKWRGRDSGSDDEPLRRMRQMPMVILPAVAAASPVHADHAPAEPAETHADHAPADDAHAHSDHAHDAPAHGEQVHGNGHVAHH